MFEGGFFGLDNLGLFDRSQPLPSGMRLAVNYLIIEALQRYHHYCGDGLKVECPTRFGLMLTLWRVATELSDRLTRGFLRRPDGTRPASGAAEGHQQDPHWRDLILFQEYFHGDTGVELGASHQTGWTALSQNCYSRRVDRGAISS